MHTYVAILRMPTELRLIPAYHGYGYGRSTATGTHRPSDKGTEEARAFANLMKKGKVKDATRLLSDDSKGTPLPLDLVVNTDDGSETVRDALHKKFPARRPLVEAALQADEPEHTLIPSSLRA